MLLVPVLVLLTLLVLNEGAIVQYWLDNDEKIIRNIHSNILSPQTLEEGIISLAGLDYYRDDIEINVVENFETLNTAFFSSCGQKKLPILRNLPNLKHLSFCDNNLDRVTDDSFSSIPVPHISLMNNRIKTIDPGSFGYQVTQVQLNCNNLDVISSDWFLAPAILEALHLDGNRINVIQPNAFAKFSSLHSVFLQHNRIHTIGARAFAYRNYFAFLDLSYNSLTELKPLTFQHGTTNIDQLNISFNNLTSLTEELQMKLFVKRTPLIDGNPWECSCYYNVLIKWVNWETYNNDNHPADRKGEPRCVSSLYPRKDCASTIDTEIIEYFAKNSSPPPETRDGYCEQKS